MFECIGKVKKYLLPQISGLSAFESASITTLPSHI